MSSLNSIYNSNNLGYNLSPNYYENKVKEGIPIFQEINGSSLQSNQNYVDPFKLLENSKNKNFLKSNPNGGFGNGAGILDTNINTTDIETRKILEREMEPYLMQMKNELNAMMEKFRNEIDEKTNISEELSSIKEQELKNKKDNEINFSNLEQKILDIKNIINIQDKKINDFQNNFNQLNRLNQAINKKADDLFINLNDLEKIKNKILSLDASNDNIYKDIISNVEKIVNIRIDQLEKNIDLIKEDNNIIKNDLSQYNIKLEYLNSEDDKKNKIINNIDTNFINLSNQIKNINLNNNKNLNLINNLEIKNNDVQQKLKEINYQISTTNDNLNSTLIDIKGQKELINSNNQKLSDINSTINILKNEK